MGEESTLEESAQSEAVVISYERILALLGLLVAIASVVTMLLVSTRFGIGVAVGGIFSVLNYYWLKSVFRNMFAGGESEPRPGLMAVKFFLRYVLFAVVLLLIYVTGVLPVIAVLIGLAGFALAVMVEGIMSIFRPA